MARAFLAVVVVLALGFLDVARGTRAGDLIGYQGETHVSQEESTNAESHEGSMSIDPNRFTALRSQTLIMGSKRPKPSHHASTIAEVSEGVFLASWFGGAFEGKPDVGIYTARFQGGTWSAPDLVVPPKGGVPTWNPVLFVTRSGETLLFYKVGRTPAAWRGFVLRSVDQGKSWGAPETLPDGILGPVKNKPVQLRDGTILCPSSVEKGHHGKEWEVYIESTPDDGHTWYRHGPIQLEGRIIQPALFVDSEDRVRALIRSRKHYMAAALGDSTGRVWGPAKLTGVPCPNTGVDAVKLKDGRVLMVYNHSFKSGLAGRGVLALAVSTDDGVTWRLVTRLEDSGGRVLEYSYPAIIQASDGLVHITFTWRRHNIKHVVLDPAAIETPITGIVMSGF
eukprot:CAMPEP_0181354174 /NCGR_PEP_ID=MMETSP1106-20121128/3221_1 /TAXON_ID=81844 /ORGANISM="Mantoniella antarctica, Strain SL-175" /LENGTH=393 /DNA_ID=CAMNT_0023466821 /DNA_START=479 /DNA_END=1660 /DNA_ORIENTATION=+